MKRKKRKPLNHVELARRHIGKLSLKELVELQGWISMRDTELRVYRYMDGKLLSRISAMKPLPVSKTKTLTFRAFSPLASKEAPCQKTKSKAA